MSQLHINPFLNVQHEDNTTILFLSHRENARIEVFDPAHPLYGIESPWEFSQRLHMLSTEDIHLLEEDEFVSQTPFERRAILKSVYERVDTPKKQHVMIFPTLNCNNSCLYCYENHSGQPSMSSKDYIAISALLENMIAGGAREIEIALMGGEPTLEHTKILSFLERCKSTCQKNDVTFGCSLTTNGRLLGQQTELVERFLKAGTTSFQITIDGPEHVHDRIRLATDGGKSFRETADGLLALRHSVSQDFVCTIRTNHTKETIFPDNLELHQTFLRTNFAGDSRFLIYNCMAADLGGEGSVEALIPIDQRKQCLQKVNLRTAELGLPLKQDFCEPNGRVCYAARTNSIIVLPGGQLLKCSVALDDPRNVVGTLSENGLLRLNDNFSLWTHDYLGRSARCGKCRVSPICQGRLCPLSRIKTGHLRCPDVKNDPRFMINMLRSHSKLDSTSQNNV